MTVFKYIIWYLMLLPFAPIIVLNILLIAIAHLLESILNILKRFNKFVEIKLNTVFDIIFKPQNKEKSHDSNKSI
jgi:hypothetical protein